MPVIPRARSLEDWQCTARLVRDEKGRKVVHLMLDRAVNQMVDEMLAESGDNIVPVPFFNTRTWTWSAI
jgi:hypothetical protein